MNRLFKFSIYTGPLVSGFIIFSIFMILLFLGTPFFLSNGLKIFMSQWSPVSGEFGILPMIKGTLFISIPAMIMAFPLSLGFAVFAAETGPDYLKKAAIFLVRTASSIPTIVYAFTGVFLLVPKIREISGGGSGYCILSASIVLAILISPTMILFFYDSIKSVDYSLNAGCDALGATKSEKVIFFILPNVKKGIYAGSFLGFGRALGDTMVSLMLAGNSVLAPDSVFDSARSLTAHIGLVMAADYDSPEFRSIFACGVILYAITGLLSVFAGFLNKGNKV